MEKISGHAFQYETEDRFRNNGWEVSSEQSYLDDVELKPRKIDFVAWQKRESYNPRGNQLALVAECKYIHHDVKFWVRQNPKDKKVYFVDGYNTERLFLNGGDFHFFTTAKVAMNMEEDTKKKDTLYEAIMQTTKALLYLRQSPQMLYTKGLFYPIVVYKSNRKMSDQDGNELKNILYYHNYEWRDPKTQDIASRSLYVNIIHESNLEKFLKDIFKREMDTLMNHVFFNKKMQENKVKNYNNPGL